VNNIIGFHLIEDVDVFFV